jgi:hypothetical protein
LEAGVNTYGYVLGSPLYFIDPFGLDCLYLIGSGLLTCDNGLICGGYSGAGNSKNKVRDQHLSFKGPIPEGDYGIGPPKRIPRLPIPGYPIIALPVEDGGYSGPRDGFYFHKDYKNNGNSSVGCIVLPQKCLDKLPPGERLRVRP